MKRFPAESAVGVLFLAVTLIQLVLFCFSVPSAAEVPDSVFSACPPPSSEPAPLAIVDLNTASQRELMLLPGIGKVLAERILAYRGEFGPFMTKEDIMNVSGIGPHTFEKLEDFAIVR